MKNFNIKSKKGFTLIELLVVIGILAVLVAIAIPSVAGLIDRANVSADNTNANEMTNAMERFVSEYELFRQDIASGTFDVNNMDATQGRVYNVTGADSIEDIRALESEAGFNGIRIDIDNKYAQNHATAKAVIENYMKTSSSTFEPKQSDMTYWYNTVTGYTLVAKKDINTATLQDLLPQEVKYGKSQPASLTEWIDLSSNIIIPDVSVVDMKVKTEVIDSANKVGIEYTFAIPNPKYNEIDLTKIYYIFQDENKVGPLLDMNSATFCNNFAENLSNTNKEYIKNSTDKKITFTYFVYGNENKYNYESKKLFRIAYEYEENGQIRYAYSPVFKASYNELNKS